MGTGFATVREEEGVSDTSADVNGFTVSELRFPQSSAHAPFEPALPYLAVVLEGNLVKSFPRRVIELGRACALTLPVGATHGARFGSDGARILIVRPRSASDPVAGCFDRLVELRGRELSWLAWRLAGELRASDAAAPLAAAGGARELLAGTAREARAERSPRRPRAGPRTAGAPPRRTPASGAEARRPRPGAARGGAAGRLAAPAAAAALSGGAGAGSASGGTERTSRWPHAFHGEVASQPPAFHARTYAH